MHSVLSRSFSYHSKNSLKNRSVLIVGAGVAGPALAYFLHRHGVQPVVVERVPQLRTAGQTIGVRDVAKEVLQRMGVDRMVREKITRESGTAVVDDAGHIRVAFDVESLGDQGFVSDIEILRGELVNILYEHSRNHTEYIFGDHPSSIIDHEDHVQVTFDSGNIRKFDLVVGADGMRSKVRRLAFENKSCVDYLNLYMAYFTISYSQSDGTWARWYNPGKGRTVLIRPDNQGTTRASLSFRSTQRGYEYLDIDAQKQLLLNVFADAGFETSRVLSELKNVNDFYFEDIGQVKMDRWSRGRVTLVGDAGYCPSPISGMGTSLALIGAYVLAGEIGRHQDHKKAFTQYEALMCPYVTKAQHIFPGAARFVAPQTHTGIALRNAVLSFAARPTNTRLIMKLINLKTAKKTRLPDYETVMTQQ